MTTTTGKLITAEEFARMPDPPDGSRQELVRGMIETMPPPGALHGMCCWQVARHLGIFVEQRGLGRFFINDTGFVSEHDPDTVRGPDVSFWSKDRLPVVPEGYIEVPPDLAVEVVSPNDHHTRIQKKVREYLAKGVRLIWVVDPFDRSVTVYRSLKDLHILTETETLEGGDVVPGFSCRVADLFP
jgi:Uma2 family endonuclease